VTIKAALDAYPRIPLAQYPTPLEFLPRLSRELARPIYIKRDDQIGPGLGGNKTRKLEYLLADAQQMKMHKVVTFGGLQSNHARITAAVARKCGMEPHLLYFEKRPSKLVGNLLLNDLSGAFMHFIPFGGNNSASMTLETTSFLVHLVAWLMVGRHYFIPVGGHNWRGCLGYVRAALEIDQQARGLGIDNAWLIMAAGSGGTLAGLLTGFSLIDSGLRPVGIDIGKLWKNFPDSIAGLCSTISVRMRQPRRFTPQQIPLVENTYVGDGYAKPSLHCLQAIKLLARLEGILLDPVYTGKAFAGLLDLAAKGNLGHDEPIIFLHTGGYPALFAFEDVDIITG
jgi:D-cysteine desulfhydrase